MKTRAEKVAHELQREIAAIVRDDVKDPRIGFVTITRVQSPTIWAARACGSAAWAARRSARPR